jgi:hypothetical protein
LTGSHKSATASDLAMLVLYEHAQMSKVLQANPAAVAVLVAFGLADAFLHRELIVKTLGKSWPDRAHEASGAELSSQCYVRFLGPWRMM